MTVFVDPVDGVPFTDADGFDDRTLWLRAHNGVGELVAATEPVWLIDARRGPVDQLGGVDPVPVTGSLLNPTDGALQSVSTQTNEGSAGASLWSTPHDAGMVPAVSVSMRARCRSVADPTTGATTAQAVWLRKTGEVDVYDEVMQVATVISNGKVQFKWIDQADDVQSAISTVGGLDVFDLVSVRADMVLATGDVTFYTDTGDGWEQLGAVVAGGGPSTVRADEGDLAFQVAKSVGFWGELWIDGALQSRFDVDDCDPGPGATVVSSATGETWTAGDDVWVAAVGRKAWYSVVSGQDVEFVLADDDVLDIGTGDFTVAAVVSPTSMASGPADLRMLFAKFNPPTIGSTGVGWGLIDYSPLGGPGFVWNDGTGLHSACGGSWSANETHVLVATGDRDGLVSFYLDDMTTPAATADLSAAGTLTNTDAVGALPPSDLLQIGAWAKWDRVLTAGELAVLPARFDA